MPTVKNLTTGLVFSVPAGHYSLSSAEFEVLPEKAAPAAPAADKPVKADKPAAKK